MIDILHRSSGRTFLTVDADTLVKANLAGEYLIHADLQDVDLTQATLSFANLSGADLRRANLRRANLRGANLTEADLTGADLSGADLSGATLSLTLLLDPQNLHEVLGLETIHHSGPSEFNTHTLSASASRLPYGFLRGAGFTRSEIVDMLQRFHPSACPPP